MTRPDLGWKLLCRDGAASHVLGDGTALMTREAAEALQQKLDEGRPATCSPHVLAAFHVVVSHPCRRCHGTGIDPLDADA